MPTKDVLVRIVWETWNRDEPRMLGTLRWDVYDETKAGKGEFMGALNDALKEKKILAVSGSDGRGGVWVLPAGACVPPGYVPVKMNELEVSDDS